MTSDDSTKITELEDKLRASLNQEILLAQTMYKESMKFWNSFKEIKTSFLSPMHRFDQQEVIDYSKKLTEFSERYNELNFKTIDYCGTTESTLCELMLLSLDKGTDLVELVQDARYALDMSSSYYRTIISRIRYEGFNLFLKLLPKSDLNAIFASIPEEIADDDGDVSGKMKKDFPGIFKAISDELKKDNN